MTLQEDQLNDLDRAILDYLRANERATPTLLMLELQDNGVETGVRQYVNSRLSRLAEHGHIRNVRDTGVYEFASDPRQSD
ncbi:hypothetical protein [Halegenticoccus tardaugens]|uniref:hypothetical protein n=1 Tax=Halegenticoccus tardaugens TaxID=2071624 RepID=UPI00100A321A|nr:hypothetical protein [Halegenticoccus tardaugens]